MKDVKAKTPKATTVTKTLTVKYDDKARKYSAYDENGNEYVADDCPRQIMMQLAHAKGQVLYFVASKWRRKKPEVTVKIVEITDSTPVEKV